MRLGAKAGVNFASMGDDQTEDLNRRTSFHVGVLVEIPISEKFAIQPELLYSSQGYKIEEVDTYLDLKSVYKDVDKLDYINIPIMAKY